ncbi:DUF6456 domain-containing protein [Sedimentitalea todarodis]|uniref:DUF6456 domain-containing protein n=1 Tax=Sedimentitalea todarodis TaxID=1631240 RepID=A0ABU3VAU1_9RHOB|nr:DUF6456 domain-containing protein [Sedimentitalea todarodis]MDU9003193.1 DUF6456 domain-containing protein [Sedimentitalea todarodis]
MENQVAETLPIWVPDSVQRYLAHTEAGQPIRDLARSARCHASTVLRQIRKVETRRDDPLVDAALAMLADIHFSIPRSHASDVGGPGKAIEDNRSMNHSAKLSVPAPDAATLESEARRVLRRLCESGAVLAVAENMEKAVIVRDGEGTTSTRTAVVDCAIAQAMALKDWIACANPGRISRYRITAAGRAALGQLLADQENRARKEKEHGFAEAQAPFIVTGEPGSPATGDRAAPPRRTRYNLSESPLIALARRKDRDGKPFLEDALVRVGERLREDFELAQMGPRVAQNWDHFLTGGGRGGFGAGPDAGTRPSEARDRVAQALSNLGPGLSDVALRCCCYLEGLETAEKKMGWSARSGKIVLRIALQRLKQHYDGLNEPDRMIG